jgi:hypothetical protein
MPKVASYTVIQDTDQPLPENGDIDHTFATFAAPNLSASPSGADRPILSFKVNPHTDDAQLEVELNGVVVYTQTFAAGPIRTLTEVIKNGELRAAGNTLTVTNRGAGDLDLSDVMVQYKATV